mmetsp:Transcript_48586/g.152713  ORF Transcript_48586/g.152713 Transcript_48586/m.152713 type:complete len:592 (-) Transcript_48586:105-1880(-)
MASSPRQVPCSSLNSRCLVSCSWLKLGFTRRRAHSKSPVLMSRGTRAPAEPIAPTPAAALFLRLGPMAALASRTGPMAASRKSACRSLPEKPSVRAAMDSTFSELRAPFSPWPELCLASCVWSKLRRAAFPGRGTYSRFGKRRRAAGSSSQGMFVAPTSSTLSSPAVSAPSKLVRNSFFTRREDSLSPSRRTLSMESISSMKITEGWRSVANWKRAFTVFSASPIHLERTLEALTLKNVAPHSAAIQRAKSVLPVPGGPKSSSPRAGRVSAEAKSSGWSCGRIRTSSICVFTNPRPAMSLRVILSRPLSRWMVASSAGTMRSSWSLSAMRSHSSLHSRPSPSLSSFFSVVPPDDPSAFFFCRTDLLTSLKLGAPALGAAAPPPALFWAFGTCGHISEAVRKLEPMAGRSGAGGLAGALGVGCPPAPTPPRPTSGGLPAGGQVCAAGAGGCAAAVGVRQGVGSAAPCRPPAMRKPSQGTSSPTGHGSLGATRSSSRSASWASMSASGLATMSPGAGNRGSSTLSGGAAASAVTSASSASSQYSANTARSSPASHACRAPRRKSSSLSRSSTAAASPRAAFSARVILEKAKEA